MPLRKPPKVTEAIRVVQVAGFDWSACGGTHVANSSQIGLIKIVGVERRGAELRVTFLCGGRARADYARLQALARGWPRASPSRRTKFLAPSIASPPRAERMRKELADLEAQWVESTAAALVGEAAPTGEQRVIVAGRRCAGRAGQEAGPGAARRVRARSSAGRARRAAAAPLHPRRRRGAGYGRSAAHGGGGRRRSRRRPARLGAGRRAVE